MFENKTNQTLHSGHRERLKSRVQSQGLKSFEDYQVLEYLLGYCIPRKDTNELAHTLINTYGSLSRVLDSCPANLQKINGIGAHTAIFLSTLPEIFSMYVSDKVKLPESFSSLTNCICYCQSKLQYLANESMIALFLDNNNRLIKCETISSGSTNACKVSVRKITELATNHNATSVIFSHNHPDTSATSSLQDDNFTSTIVLALTLLGINVLDHIIVSTDGEFYSYHKSGKLSQYRNNAIQNINGAIVATTHPDYKGD